MTGVKWHSSARTLATRKRGTANVIRVMRAMMLGGGVSLMNTGCSPTDGGDIYWECCPHSMKRLANIPRRANTNRDISLKTLDKVCKIRLRDPDGEELMSFQLQRQGFS